MTHKKGACVAGLCIGGCTGFQAQLSPKQHPDLKGGQVFGKVMTPQTPSDCNIGGKCGGCDCCTGFCVDDVCVGGCFNTANEFLYAKKEKEGESITDVKEICVKTTDCDCCVGGMVIAGECFGTCLSAEGAYLNQKAKIEPAVKSVSDSHSAIGSSCGNCPHCIGACFEGVCIGSCIDDYKDLLAVFSPQAGDF